MSRFARPRTPSRSTHPAPTGLARTACLLGSGRQLRLVSLRAVGALVPAALLVLAWGGAAPAAAIVPDPPEKACRAFVQEFYDWYAKRSHKGAFGIEEALKERRRVFDAELVRRLREDAAAAAKAPGEIVGLDFDPVLNAQDIAEKYIVGAVRRQGVRFRVDVFGYWNGRKSPRPDVTPEVLRAGSRWVFTNFYYRRDGKQATSNLLQVLQELKRERK